MIQTTTDRIVERLAARGLELPPPWKVPGGTGEAIPASLVRRVGTRLFVSGHVPTGPDGVVIGPFGRVGAEVGIEVAQQSAVRTMLSVIASVQEATGDLGRVSAWCRLNCMVNSAPDFSDFPTVFNPASQLLVDLFGPEQGGHARIAVGVAGLPWNIPVEIEAELELTEA